MNVGSKPKPRTKKKGGIIKKISTESLIRKIEKLTKQRMSDQPVVALDQFRSAHKKLHPTNILVIEDDETQRHSLKKILETDGYTPKMAADGTELGLILDQEAEIHLIIMDVGLPWINGFELAQMIKDHPDLKRIPLLFLSATAEPADMERAREVEADDYIKKPFDIEIFRHRVKELLEFAQHD